METSSSRPSPNGIGFGSSQKRTPLSRTRVQALVQRSVKISKGPAPLFVPPALKCHTTSLIPVSPPSPVSTLEAVVHHSFGRCHIISLFVFCPFAVLVGLLSRSCPTIVSFLAWVSFRLRRLVSPSWLPSCQLASQPTSRITPIFSLTKMAT